MRIINRFGQMAISIAMLIAVGACMTKGATAAGAQTPPASSAKSELSRFGFYVYPEPIALPAFSAPGLSGGSFSSGSIEGLTLLNFWATWCPPCRREMPSIERLYAKLAPKGLRIAAISVGERKADVESFIARQKYTFPIYLDESGSLGGAFASQGIPTTYLVDRSGRAIAVIVGSREYDDPALVALLERMLAE